ncbi:MAG: M48 family metalloprotease [Fimbriimonadaceae bacterium]|nr:M48 family metalloprotease [Chitinophagales bacterium]
MRTAIFFTAIFIYTQAAFCQTIDFTNYQGLYSSGIVPDDFTKLSSQKYKDERENINTSESRRDQLSQDQFYLESNFLTDRLLHSGRVVFGDPVTNYLNEIKAIILKDDPKLKEKIRIYTYRSNDANAYTFNNGIVLVTTGLLMQAENEAQIAFILCHEFKHYVEQHAISSYVESERMDRGDGVYRNLNSQDVELAQLRYSKDLEIEADEKGLELYKKTNYNAEAVSSAFDVLLYSYLPFDEVEFNKTYFNHGTFQIPDDYILDSLKEISAQEDYDDSESTHPNIKSRKEDALEILGNIDNTNRKDFLVSEETFRYVQNICRYEAVKLYLTDLNYEYAFYSNYLLMLDDPENPYLQKNMAKALYSISRYKTDRSYSTDMHVSYQKIEGNAQQIYYMAEKLPAKDFSILALQSVWKAYKNNPQDKTLEIMTDELMYDVLKKHNIKIKDLKTEYPITVVDSVAVKKEDTAEKEEVKEEKTTSKSSKYKKIKESKEEEETTTSKTGDNAYWKYAFVELLKDEIFSKKFTEAEKDRTVDLEDSYEKYDKKKDEYALGINKIVVVDPLYMKVDETSKTAVKYVASEQGQLDMRKKIDDCADELNMKVDFVSSKEIDSKDVEAFNDLAILNDWLSEKLEHEDQEVEILNSTQEEMKTLAKKYEVDNFVWIGILSIKEKEENIGLKIVGLLIPYTMPFVVYDLIEPNNYSYFFTLVANGNTGNMEMQYFNGTNLKDRDSVQKSNIYYILHQMKNKNRK